MSRAGRGGEAPRVLAGRMAGGERSRRGREAGTAIAAGPPVGVPGVETGATGAAPFGETAAEAPCPASGDGAPAVRGTGLGRIRGGFRGALNWKKSARGGAWATRELSRGNPQFSSTNRRSAAGSSGASRIFPAGVQGEITRRGTRRPSPIGDVVGGTTGSQNPPASSKNRKIAEDGPMGLRRMSLTTVADQSAPRVTLSAGCSLTAGSLDGSTKVTAGGTDAFSCAGSELTGTTRATSQALAEIEGTSNGARLTGTPA
jgi:hypothetical protein